MKKLFITSLLVVFSASVAYAADASPMPRASATAAAQKRLKAYATVVAQKTAMARAAATKVPAQAVPNRAAPVRVVTKKATQARQQQTPVRRRATPVSQQPVPAVVPLGQQEQLTEEQTREQRKKLEQQRKEQREKLEQQQKEHGEKLTQQQKESQKKVEQQQKEALEKQEQKQREAQKRQEEQLTEAQKKEEERTKEQLRKQEEQQKRMQEQQNEEARKQEDRQKEELNKQEQQSKEEAKKQEERRMEEAKKQEEQQKQETVKQEEQQLQDQQEPEKTVVASTGQRAEDYKRLQQLFAAAKQAEAENNYKKAFYAYSEVMNIKTYFYPVTYKKIAYCYQVMGNLEQSILFYQKYVKYAPTDTAVIEYIPKLEAALTKKKLTVASFITVDAEYKLPASALTFSFIDVMVPFYSGFGNYYSRSKGQNWFPISGSLSILGDFMVAGAYALQQYSKGLNALYYSLYDFGAMFISTALIYDFFTSPFIAVENTEKFLYMMKTTEQNVKEEKLDYKDPVFTALVSFVGGTIVPGAGHLAAGNIDVGVKLSIITPVIVGTAFGVGAYFNAKPSADDKAVGNYIYLGAAGLYGIFRLVDLYGSLTQVDTNNTEYYRQLLCPNSPYRITEKRDEREPWLAFLIALGPGAIAHGAGNFYADNYWTAFTLLGSSLAGAGMYLANSSVPDSNAAPTYIKYAGLAIFGLTYLYDVATAPGNTAIYNAIYTNRQENQLKENKLGFAPIVAPNTLGLNLTYQF